MSGNSSDRTVEAVSRSNNVDVDSFAVRKFIAMLFTFFLDSKIDIN